MRWMWTVDEGSGVPYTVLVDADADAPIAALADALSLPVEALAPGADGDASALDSAPESGAILPLRPRPIAGAMALQFRGGPLAGHVVPLTRGRLTVGRARDSDIVIGDPSVARHHGAFVCADDEVRFLPAGPEHAALVNGVSSSPDGVPLAPNDLLELGHSVVSVGPRDVATGDVHRDGGDLAFNRPARIAPRRRENTVRFPGPRPADSMSAPMPWAMALVPPMMGGTMALVSHNPAMLLMALASPVMVVANYRTQRRNTSKRGQSATATWVTARAKALGRLADITAVERVAAWHRSPDPATVRDWCTGHGPRLWERRAEDLDALTVRLGVAELPAPVTVDPQGAEPPEAPVMAVMSPVPVTVDLRSVGVLGIAGPRAVTAPLGRWVALQLAAARSPRDLQLVVLCASGDESAWGWTAWLPHCQIAGASAPAALIGNTTETRVARLAELSRQIEERVAQRRDDREVRFTDIVVLIDGARRFRTEAGMSTLLRDGPTVGVYAVCLDDDRVRVPEEANAQLVVGEVDEGFGVLDVRGQGAIRRVLVDSVSGEVAAESARAMAPLRHVGGDGDSRALPNSVRLVDVLSIDLDDPQWLATRWSIAGRSTTAVIGAGLDGPFAVDLKLDGPHALVAGTTGAGKSEFLQTLVVSLALTNRPDALQFVLIDYKGASAFADCERLPHTVGMVTNLDNRETERALESLDAELERRERVLKSMGAKDVDDAWDRDPGAAASSGMARLLLVIDEFAELVHELPTFVTGLIRIARVGRSLGIHLVLATQRPAGVVSSEMQANLGLRVALRMADKENSAEVLGGPDAALISSATPGRGFVRRGPGTAPSGFQTARVAGRRPGRHAVTIASPPVVHRVTWNNVGRPVPPAPPRVWSGDSDATDLHALVELIRGATERLAIPAGRSPWLPAIPTLVTLDELASLSGRLGSADDAPPEGILLGLLDLPAAQQQAPLRYVVGRDGHLAIGGSARSGRSSVLRTIIAGVAAGYTPDDVHLYCVDFGGNALTPAADLPHCGAVVSGLETERVTRLLSRLTQEITDRQQLLGRHGFGDIAEQRRAAATSGDAPLPHVLLLLDRWEGFTSAFSVEELQGMRDLVIKILREGPSVGVAMIVTGDRALINDRIAAFIETRYTLRLSDREDYRLVNIRPAALPELIPPGRAYFGEPVKEMQFAVVSADTSGQGQTAALREAVASARARSTHLRTRPFRLDILPSFISLRDAAALPDALPVDEAALPLLVAVGGDDLSRYRIDFGAGPGFIIGGARQTGRSTALANAALWWQEAGVDVLVIAPKPSPLSTPQMRAVFPTVDRTDTAAAEQVMVWLAAHNRCAVLVDDADVVHGSALDDVLVESARSRTSGGFALVVAAPVDGLATLLRGVAVEAKRHKQGLLMSATSSMDGNVLGAAVPRNFLGRAAPGRAVLLTAGGWVPVQLPGLPDAALTDAALPGPG